MALLMASTSPVASAISANRREPAWAATPLPSGVTFNAGSRLLTFTLEVPFSLVRRFQGATATTW
jgi:hypothetical protein